MNMLIYMGTDLRCKDKLHDRLDALINKLKH